MKLLNGGKIMSDNMYENNFGTNPENNGSNDAAPDCAPAGAPDYTPDEYYRKNYSNQDFSAENYARYGESFYNGNPQASQSQTRAAQSGDYQNPYGGYSSPYNSNTYNYPYNNHKPPKPKKVKKEKKPVTRATVAVVLIVSILCSAVLGAGGGYFAATHLNNSSGLTISKSDGSSSSYAASGASLTTTEIVNKAADSVVEITTEAVVTGSFSQQYIQEGAGSGVIISDDGYIITNYHVIEGASEITVTLRDHTEFTDITVVGLYEAGDLALLKVKSDKALPAATFGNSDNLSVGDYAVAIGNPLGQLGGTVTDGIISALDREVTIDNETMNLLQTNAEISPGNSGGGLFNGAGELIGIVNAKSSTEASEGLGFAIPINDVQDVLSDLKEYGYVKGQIDLGMSLSDISSTAGAWIYGASQTGVYVTSVNNGSNAAKAGFRAGDIIAEVNGTEVSSTSEVNDILKEFKVGDTVSFKVYRNGSTGTLKMELEEYTNATKNTNSGSNTNRGKDNPWSIFGY